MRAPKQRPGASPGMTRKDQIDPRKSRQQNRENMDFSTAKLSGGRRTGMVGIWGSSATQRARRDESKRTSDEGGRKRHDEKCRAERKTARRKETRKKWWWCDNGEKTGQMFTRELTRADMQYFLGWICMGEICMGERGVVVAVVRKRGRESEGEGEGENNREQRAEGGPLL